MVGETISLIAAPRILSMERIGELDDQRPIEFARINAVGKTSLIVDNIEIVDGAEDVVEAKLYRRQVTRTVVLDKGRGQQTWW